MNKIFQRCVESKFFHSAGIYTLGHIVNAAIPFILMPVLTRYLTPADYGITAMLAVLMGIYTPLVGINLPGYLSVAYFKHRKDLVLVIPTIVRLIGISILFFSAITYIFSDEIEKLTQFPKAWLWSIILLCFSGLFVQILQTLQQVQSHAKEYTVIQVGQTIMNLFLSLFFVVLLVMNWQGRILAQIITGVFFMLLAIIILNRKGLLSWRFEKKYAFDSLRFGIPLIPHALSGFFVLAADRLFISNMIGLEEVGIFSVGFSLGRAIELLGTAFNQAFAPWLYGKLKDLDDGKAHNEYKIVKFTYLCMFGFITVSVIYSLCMPWFLKFFVGIRFQGASQYILWFALASALHAIYYLVVNYIFYRQKTQYLAVITFTSSIMHIGITYIMIQNFGAVGAAYASVLTNGIMAIMTWWLSNKVYPMPWNLCKKNH